MAGNFWMLRLLGYPGFSESEIAKVPQVECGDVGRGAPIDDGLGAHTDDGLVTFIDQTEDIYALQVKTPSGEWVNAPPVPGALVCVLGEMLKILSKGIYEATAHKVYNSSPKYRVAIGFFYEKLHEKNEQLFDRLTEKTSSSGSLQVQGEWKTRNPNMSRYCSEARDLMSQFKSCDMELVPRGSNRDADAGANTAVNLPWTLGYCFRDRGR